MNITLQPAVLKWARERVGLSIDVLADKVGTRPHKVAGWESSGELTFRQSERLAHVTHVPFGCLFLDKPPVEKLPINDFRTVGSETVGAPSPEILETIDTAIEQQNWFREYLVTSGEKPLDWVGSLRDTEDVAIAAQRIRERFKLDTTLRSDAANWEEALRLQSERLENQGVLVTRNGIVGQNTHRPLSVNEFRGFAISDPYAPLIFINNKDAKAAQMFTLMHELVHLWLGVSGVSNISSREIATQQTEAFCNAVAAEILVPENELRALFANEKDLLVLGRHFKVSSLVILWRWRNLNLVNQQEFSHRYQEELADFEARERKSSGGDYYIVKLSRLGKRFSAALITSALEGTTPPVEAYRLLGVRNTEKMRNLARELELGIV